MSERRKLTAGQRRVLDYAASQGEVALWPMPLYLMNRCLANGWLEICGREPGVMGFTKYRLTDAGRAMLEETGP